MSVLICMIQSVGGSFSTKYFGKGTIAVRVSIWIRNREYSRCCRIKSKLNLKWLLTQLLQKKIRNFCGIFVHGRIASDACFHEIFPPEYNKIKLVSRLGIYSKLRPSKLYFVAWSVIDVSTNTVLFAPISLSRLARSCPITFTSLAVAQVRTEVATRCFLIAPRRHFTQRSSSWSS